MNSTIAIRQHSNTLAADISYRKQQLEPLLHELLEAIRVFPNDGTVATAEAIWASLGQNWQFESTQARRNVIDLLQRGRRTAIAQGKGADWNPLPSVAFVVEDCRIQHQVFLVAPPVPIPSYFRSELEPIIRSKETAHELYRQCTQHCRYENCKLQIEKIWDLCSQDWYNLPSSVQTFYIREFGRIKSIVKWTNLAIDQGFFRPHDRHNLDRRMVGIDVAAQLRLPSSVMYEHAQRNLNRTVQLDGESNLQSILERIVQRYSPQQAQIAHEWTLILQDQIPTVLSEIETVEMGPDAMSTLRKERLKTILDALVRLWNSPPLSAFDLPATLTDLVERRDFSVFGRFLTRLRHSAQQRQGLVQNPVYS